VICDGNEGDLCLTERMLHEILSDTGRTYEMQIYRSANDLLGQAQRIDIAILDTMLGARDGIAVGRELKNRFPKMRLIYLASQKQYCMQAINKVHAFSFLAKPLEKSLLQGQIEDLIGEMEAIANNEEKVFFNVTDEGGNEISMLKLRLRDIIYFEKIKTKRRVQIVTGQGSYAYYDVMEKLVEELRDMGFAVNCRGNLVNLRHITKIRGYDLYLDNGEQLALSQRRVAEFKEQMNMFR